MTVYVVTRGDEYESSKVVAVFDNLESAKAYVNMNETPHGAGYDIDEMEVLSGK